MKAPLLCCGEAPARSGPLTTVHVARLKRTLSVAVAPRATIQALEVQKMTLATLKSMNFNLGDIANALTTESVITLSVSPCGIAVSQP